MSLKLYCISALLLIGGTSGCLYEEAKPLVTAETSKFGPFIEGTSVDKEGNIYAVNFGDSTTLATIGAVTPEQRLFFEDTQTPGTAFNGIRFGAKEAAENRKVAYLADYKNHRVVQVEVNSKGEITSKNFCANPNIIQPNDLALAQDGRIFLSGMKFQNNTQVGDGDIWLCTRGGRTRRLDVMGRTNGIELSPGDKYLYVSEALDRNSTTVSNRIWRYRVHSSGRISHKKLFFDFDSVHTGHLNIDGIRSDINGNLFVVRHGGQEVLKMSPKGRILASIKVSFTFPTNIELGGEKGTTLHIVGRCGIDTPDGEGVGCVDTWENDAPGRAWSLLQ
ncbi:calcium-dependent phosphotriesterase [Basidiobolus meristosporus CBS 931.73]|uniref:Calcium-dependent phosphotriesterase n=1 Tax=Basidiobolus meristosporus CBS 931.73 TaxID=1314790 RepID=A0A1Y1Y3R6_9FUNG|nr:calcium-dependent phosphotriesterase [Basidiobolus meristosporus CBS 931.73]|eukprot:ORX92637.1 calcium-dependent phosphotriesterase [Basidiobolus meristosporus CBS 931.73]